ncbi:MAG: agmatinase [Anaerolineales bacterium]|nr:agmatinase [Anaerolineales bacterium]
MHTWEDFVSGTVKAQIGVLGVANDENSSYLRGAAGAPPLIRQAFYSPSSNLWTETGIDLGGPDPFVDVGDLQPIPGIDSFTEIEAAAGCVLGHNLRLLSLGGDHAVTYSLVRAVAQHYPRLSILHFDAHPDLYDEFEGSRRSHACPFARIMEAGLAQRLVQVGIRGMNAHQRRQAECFLVEMIEMKDWRDDITLHFNTPVYVSFDMDCLDPAFAPGISHWEPGGLSTRQALRLIQAIDAPIVAADIVEFNPQVEAQITARVAAKVFKELAGKMLGQAA